AVVSFTETLPLEDGSVLVQSAGQTLVSFEEDLLLDDGTITNLVLPTKHPESLTFVDVLDHDLSGNIALIESLSFVDVVAETSGDDDGEEEPPPYEPPGPGPIDPGMIIANCEMAEANGALITDNVDITFDDTKQESGRNKVCEFGPSPEVANELGNLGKKNMYQQARYEQDRTVELPAGAVLCDLTLQMDKQRLKYDDMFYMSLNGQVIASNADYVLRGDTTTDGDRVTQHPGLQTSSIVNGAQSLIPTYVYDWSKIRGGYFNDSWLKARDTDYCLGEEQGLASCQWPKTDTDGDFEFTYDPTILKALGSLSTNGVHTFKYAITGDDDEKKDCYHQEFTFAVEVKYYVPSQGVAQTN
ncbi:MAG: hypothetical protein HRT45_17330, partial [Bdellovibrionales bacterium]|nr:hypothetical protein [Bdellovibrionales bacterium]